MKEQTNITKHERTTSLETFIMNICKIEDEKYKSYKNKKEKLHNRANNVFLAEVIIFTIGLSFLLFMTYKVSVLIFIIYLAFWFLMFPFSHDVIYAGQPDFNYEIKKIVSIYNHEDIMSLQHPNPHMLLLLKFILIPENVFNVNIKEISDMLVENNIKHQVQDVSSEKTMLKDFILTIYFDNTKYIIKSNSILSTTLTMPDNLRLDVLKLCNLDELFSNESDWDEIVKYIKQKNNIEEERTMMNNINELNNINI